jgi:hypothetical protein
MAPQLLKQFLVSLMQLNVDGLFDAQKHQVAMTDNGTRQSVVHQRSAAMGTIEVRLELHIVGDAPFLSMNGRSSKRLELHGLQEGPVLADDAHKLLSWDSVLLLLV